MFLSILLYINLGNSVVNVDIQNFIKSFHFSVKGKEIHQNCNYNWGNKSSIELNEPVNKFLNIHL